MTATSPPHLDITHDPAGRNLIHSLLQRGILIPVDTPCSVIDLLLTLPGFDRQYIETNAQTIFINNSAADSLERRLNPGDSLAISGPMPGLAGAIFRRSGNLGSLRARTGDHRKTDHRQCGHIHLKLFNTHIREKAAGLLGQGVLVSGPVLATFLTKQRQRLTEHIKEISLEGRPLELAEVAQQAASISCLLVRAANGSA